MTSAPHYADDQVTLYHGDCLDVLRSLPDASVDAVVTDPPYGLEFMGKEWDRFAGKVSDRDFKGFVLSQQRTRNVKCPECQRWAYDHPGRACECGGVRRAQGSAFQRWCEQWAREALRVLKPGGHMLAFGGTRTWHRLVCAVEDAGFEIRDSMAWLYGSGFPKSLDVSKAIDKAAGAEREVIGTGTAGASSLERVRRVEMGYRENLTAVTPEAYPITAPATDEARRWQGWGTALKPGHEPLVVARKPPIGTVAANVLAYGTGALNIDGCRVAHDDDLSRYDRSATSGFKRGGVYGDGEPVLTPTNPTGRWPTNVVLSHAPLLDDCGEVIGDACADGCVPGCPVAELDAQSGVLTSGANPTRRSGDKFRDAYGDFAGQTECVPARGADSGGASRFFPTFRYEAKAPDHERPRVNGTAHPTVKPLELIRWLVRLATPPGGLVLDPFAGSGTTVEAALMEGFRVAGIERDADYLPLIQARVERAHRRLQPGVARLGKDKPPAQLAGQGDLLAEIGGIA